MHHPHPFISDKMKQAIRLFKEHETYIFNSFQYDINNQVIEGTNNLIKCIKRIQIFSHFAARILLIKGIIKG